MYCRERVRSYALQPELRSSARQPHFMQALYIWRNREDTADKVADKGLKEDVKDAHLRYETRQCEKARECAHNTACEAWVTQHLIFLALLWIIVTRLG